MPLHKHPYSIMRGPLETSSFPLFGSDLDPSSCLDGANAICVKSEDSGSPAKLLTPPVVPSQCCTLGIVSSVDHCRSTCTAHDSRSLYTGYYNNFDHTLGQPWDRAAPFHKEHALSREAMSEFSSSPPFSTLTASSPPSSCVSTSSPASIGLALEWNFVADKSASPAFGPTQREYQPHFCRQTAQNSNFSETVQTETSSSFDGFAERQVTPSGSVLQPALSLSQQAAEGSSSAANYTKSVERARDSIVCDVPGCHRLFANIYNLNDHRRTHLRPRERPHACPLHGCPKKYFYRRDLVRHLRKHHSAVDVIQPFSARSLSRLGRTRARSSE